ncbi:hypothetical protein FA95DRAFT_1681818 [Auriscalpium vulgare]|uniref:Uncharacterized protein n=1 Tax=Auriscalpium vulgare TaxID=40419 RepID=A0ACB8RI43_9AGAM|nr:hypothetical protein FA95DRAFT_1681818 [Auriscalpium vulgare]
MSISAATYDVSNLGTQITISNALSAPPLAILYYDWLLMLDLEVAYYWPPTHKLGWVSVFYLLNRYICLLGYTPFIRDLFTYGTVNVCHSLTAYHQSFQVALQILVGVLCIMRMYALYNRSRFVLGFLIAVALFSIVIGVWVVVTYQNQSVQIIASTIPGCNQLLSNADGRHLAAAWSGVLVFDTIIFILTAYKGFKLGLSTRGGLLHVLIRDGTVYFTVLFLANLGNILMLLLGPPALKAWTTTFINILSSTLISRVMINLRAAPILQWTPGPSTTISDYADVGAPLTTTFDIGFGTTSSPDGSFGRDRERYLAGDIELVVRSKDESS